MRVVLLAVFLALTAASGAAAKGSLVVRVSDDTPAVGQSFTVTVRTGWVVPTSDWLRLVAVAPDRGWYDVIGTVTGDSVLAKASIPRDGFEIKLQRVAPTLWRAIVRLPRAGRWRLVVPNGTHAGFMTPPPAAWMPWVAVHR